MQCLQPAVTCAISKNVEERHIFLRQKFEMKFTSSQKDVHCIIGFHAKENSISKRIEQHAGSILRNLLHHKPTATGRGTGTISAYLHKHHLINGNANKFLKKSFGYPYTAADDGIIYRMCAHTRAALLVNVHS